MENKKDIEELKKHLKKCLSPLERPMEIEHIQAIIAKTHEIKGAQRVWRIAEKQNLTQNPFTVWKFCNLMHEILHRGHKQALSDGLTYKGHLEKYARYWQQLRGESMGECIGRYCKVLLRKLEFHQMHKHFKGNLEMEYEPTLNVDRTFQICLDILDYLEDLMQLQRVTFENVECHHIRLTSKKAMCRLQALTIVAKECSLLYQHCMNALQFLDSTLPPDAVSGLCERFNAIANGLQKLFVFMHSQQLLANNFDVVPMQRSLMSPSTLRTEETSPAPSAPCISDFDDLLY